MFVTFHVSAALSNKGHEYTRSLVRNGDLEMKRLTNPASLLCISLGLLTFGLSIIGCGGSPASAAAPGGCNGFSHCMTLFSSTTITPTPNVVGFSYSGSMVFTFSPAPPAGTLVGFAFTNSNPNASGISAGGTADGSSQVTATVAGSTVSCGFVNPTQINAYFNGNTLATEATTNITWNTTTC